MWTISPPGSEFAETFGLFATVESYFHEIGSVNQDVRQCRPVQPATGRPRAASPTGPGPPGQVGLDTRRPDTAPGATGNRTGGAAARPTAGRTNLSPWRIEVCW
ncbi:hypothetical protein Vlu01_49690 [Micromonospora lutea]|uniref:Uncharacterized protein n=1 Tax=Micromonospora lutea TaxID=419825 RepID=A0ABQ4J2G1_9ACTN|nr:hypothetical protein Vlu01_49690 [Micromonospora lutea]